MDIQTLSYVVERISTISRLADDSAEFKSLIDILSMELQDEIDVQDRMINEQFEEWAEEIYYDQLALRDSDGSACLGIQVA